MADPILRALPGRVILVFPAARKKTDTGLFIPETSQTRPEFGELHSIGEATSDAEEIQRDEIIAAAEAGHKFPVTFAAGVSYWRTDFGDRYDWLKDYRTFRISELSAILVETT